MLTKGDVLLFAADREQQGGRLSMAALRRRFKCSDMTARHHLTRLSRALMLRRHGDGDYEGCTWTLTNKGRERLRYDEGRADSGVIEFA